MSARLFWIALALLAMACSRPFWTAAHQLPAEDPRRAYVGEWQIAFALDATRDPGRGQGEWQPVGDTARWVTGSLEVRDSIADPGQQSLAADLTVDFTPLLGRPMSCLRPTGSGLQITETRELVSLWFTPGAFDCGLTGSARRDGDSLTGAWEEGSLVGPVARGRFRMRPKGHA